MNERMIIFSNFLKDLLEKQFITHDFAETYIEKLDELIIETDNNTSLDAYARTLSLNRNDGEQKLIHLKAILSGYLIFEQLIKPVELKLYTGNYDDSVPPEKEQVDDELHKQIHTHVDKRYNKFWGQYLSDEDVLPNNAIRIISWNYDMQFEFSYSMIKGLNTFQAQKELQVFPSESTEIDLKRFNILKLNGTAGLYYNNQQKKLDNFFDLPNEDLTSPNILLANLNVFFDTLKNNFHRAFYNPILTFAWEDDIRTKEARGYAASVISESEILVIIGYSFPDFNRKIDRIIFENVSNLKKIYFQVPESDFPEYLERLGGINTKLPKLTVNKSKLDDFFIPPEI
jgi:hypothetical protein